MSAAVYYRNKCLIECSSGFLYSLSNKMIELGLKRGYSLNGNLLGHISILDHSSVFSLENFFSVEEMKVYAELAIQAISMMVKEGYFIPTPETIKLRIENNIPLDLPFRNHMEALEYEKNLQEILQELSNT